MWQGILLYQYVNVYKIHSHDRTKLSADLDFQSGILILSLSNQRKKATKFSTTLMAESEEEPLDEGERAE